MDFSEWLGRRLKQLHKKQTHLVHLGGPTKGTVSLWVKGDSFPSRKFIPQLALDLKVEQEDLIALIKNPSEALYKTSPDRHIGYAVQEANKNTSENYKYQLTAQLPILNSTQATSPAKSIAAGDFEGVLGDFSGMKLGKNAFYFRLDDDSMYSAERPLFRRGALVAIDPDGAVEPGVYVLAKTNIKGQESIIFRGYFERESESDFESFELVPINKAVKTIRVQGPGQAEILGVLVGFGMSASDLRFG
jgi:SOS-response transcriptional repressor LexA